MNYSVTGDPEDMNYLQKLGGGNRSAGIAIAAKRSRRVDAHSGKTEPVAVDEQTARVAAAEQDMIDAKQSLIRTQAELDAAKKAKKHADDCAAKALEDAKAREIEQKRREAFEGFSNQEELDNHVDYMLRTYRGGTEPMMRWEKYRPAYEARRAVRKLVADRLPAQVRVSVPNSDDWDV